MTKDLKNLGLSTRVFNTLTKAGIKSIEQLSLMTLDELKAIKGISDKSAEEIQSKLSVANVVKKENSNENFNKNTTYIFTKKKYIKCEGRKSYKANKEWVDKLNGKTVDISTGTIKEKSIYKKWCISKNINK